MDRRTVASRVVLALALPLAGPAVAQNGPCGPGNARLWCAHQDQAAVGGVAQPNDRFGAALALGDFNDDGRLDLAVGSPGEADGIANNAGLVHVFYGAGLQLQSAGSQVIDQDSSVLDDDGGTESGDRFGAALAVGDFDGDGIDDLAVGSPGEDVEVPFGECGLDLACDQGGAVHVYFGSANGLVALSSTYFDVRDSDAVSNQDGAAFGSTLSALDLDADAVPELMVGVPGSGNGEVRVLTWNGFALEVRFEAEIADPESDGSYPSALAAGPIGLGAGGRRVAGCALCDGGATDAGVVEIANVALLVQTDFGTAGAAAGDRFGASVAIGDFDGDTLLDLAIGAPFKNHGAGNPGDSGRVYVAEGPIEDGEQNEIQIVGEDDVVGQSPAADERFGSALVAGDFDGDGVDDLVVGAPGEFSGSDGAFFLLTGGPADLAGTTRYNEGSLGGTSGDGHLFGSVFAAGDLDGDGVDELVVGVPDAPVGGDDAAGIVYVTRILDPSLVFLDGFEAGEVTSWSATTP